MDMLPFNQASSDVRQQCYFSAFAQVCAVFNESLSIDALLGELRKDVSEHICVCELYERECPNTLVNEVHNLAESFYDTAARLFKSRKLFDCMAEGVYTKFDVVDRADLRRFNGDLSDSDCDEIADLLFAKEADNDLERAVEHWLSDQDTFNQEVNVLSDRR